MTKDKIKEVMDACYQAKRIRDMLPALPGGYSQKVRKNGREGKSQ